MLVGWTSRPCYSHASSAGRMARDIFCLPDAARCSPDLGDPNFSIRLNVFLLDGGFRTMYPYNGSMIIKSWVVSKMVVHNENIISQLDFVWPNLTGLEGPQGLQWSTHQKSRFWHWEGVLLFWFLVGGFNPSEKLVSWSIGMIIPNIWKNQRGSKPPSRFHMFDHLCMWTENLRSTARRFE
jgi:hypothetical protein